MAETRMLQEEIKNLVAGINRTHQHPHPELISFLKIIEEIGEITQVLLKTQIRSRKHEKEEKELVKEEAGNEIADAIIALISLANDFEVDLTMHLERKLAKHKERNKGQSEANT